jgi:hypothetical protein
MIFLNSKKSFQSMGLEYSLRRDLTASKQFLFYRFETNQIRCAKNIPKTVLKTKLKTKGTTYTLVFAKYLVVFFPSHSKSTVKKFHVKSQLS